MARAETGTGVPGLRRPWLARRLGLDGNPLRRRTDKAASCFALLLLTVFLTGVPLLSAAAGWTGRSAGAGQQASRSWHQVPAVLLQAAPAAASGVNGYSWVRARWIAPEGRTRTGRIPVSTHLAAGRTVRLWVNAAGSPAGPPLNHRAVLAREATAATVAIATPGIVLLCLAWGRPVGARPAPARRLGNGMVSCRPAMDQALLVAGPALLATLMIKARPGVSGRRSRISPAGQQRQERRR